MRPGSVLIALLPLLGAGPSVSVTPAEGTADPALKQQFLKLAEAKDTEGLGKLAKSRLDDTVAWIVKTCEEFATRPSDETESFSKVLRDAWKAGVGTGFAEKEYDALKNLGANRRDRNDLRERLEASLQEFDRNSEHKDSLAFQNVVDEMDVVAPGLDQVGDLYRCSQAWILQARSCDESMRGEGADLHKACFAYIKALEARDKLELKDSVYEEIAKRKAYLVSKGYDKKKEAPAEPAGAGGPGGKGGAPGAGGAASSAEAAGATITAAASFEAIPALDAYLRPNFMDDEINLLWAGLPIKAKGSSATFTRMQGSPAVIRVGPSDVRLDTNGDGQGDEKLQLTGNPLLVKITVGKGEQARPWAFLAQIGNEKDSYQRISINNQPNDQQYTIYTLAAASITGNIGGTPVRVIDEDLDGVYGNRPQIWAEIGLSKDMYQPEMDSIVIGSSKRARPWSEVQEIGGKWYRLAPSPLGKELQATPLTIDTGVLKLDFKGPAPTWVVVQQQGNENQGCFFDLVEGGSKGVNVPIGSYKLFYGEIRKGKKSQIQKTLILPPKGMPSVDVVKGQTTTMTLGAPFGFDFVVTTEGEKAKVEGGSVVIVGSQGERYERPWDCVPRPEVLWRKKGAKSSTVAGKMGQLIDSAAFSKGYDVAWFPVDFEFSLKNEKGPIEVQLLEKKHDIFGKIESAWKD